MHKRILKVAALFALLPSLALAEIAVITHKATPVDALTPAQVKALFLQKEKHFPGGPEAVLGDQSHDSPVYKAFVETVLGKSTKKMKRYWSKRVFAGKGVPPKEIGDDAAMKAWVASTPNSLGYIDAAAVDDTVKVLLRQ